MPITISFRGVGIYVRETGNDSTVVEVLFPNAEQDGPPNAEIGDDGFPRHADNTRATDHFAGVLIPRTTGNEYRKLLGRRVEFPRAGPTTIDGKFAGHFPSVTEATNGSGFGLTLIKEAEREVFPWRAATRILLSGGTLTPKPSFAVDFNIDGHHAKGGTPIATKQYSTGGVWTSDKGVESIELAVSTFPKPGQPSVAEPLIKLDSAASTAHFYNFDNGLPSLEDLDKSALKLKCKGRLTDHDFKWIYKLMDFAPPFTTWQEWLKGEEFPAPWAPCAQLSPTGPGKSTPGVPTNRLLVPISTCFGTVV
jgi:hypothetical protein